MRSHGATAGRATGTAHHRGTCPGPVRRTPARAMPPLHCAPATAPRLRERCIAFQPVPLRRPAEDRSASTARRRPRSAATHATRRMRPTHPPPTGDPDTRAAADGGPLSLRLRCSFLRVWACAEGPPTAAAGGLTPAFPFAPLRSTAPPPATSQARPQRTAFVPLQCATGSHRRQAGDSFDSLRSPAPRRVNHGDIEPRPRWLQLRSVRRLARRNGSAHGAHACAPVAPPCAISQPQERLCSLPPPHRHPLAQDPRCRVPAASSLPNLPLQRPGGVRHNRALWPGNRLACHGPC